MPWRWRSTDVGGVKDVIASDDLGAKVRDGISPLLGVMLASRFLLYYFSVELIFGVPNHFGKDSDAVLREMADIFRHGMLRPQLEPLETGPARGRA